MKKKITANLLSYQAEQQALEVIQQAKKVPTRLKHAMTQDKDNLNKLMKYDEN